MVHLTCQRQTNAKADLEHVLQKFFNVGKLTPNRTLSPTDSHTQTDDKPSQVKTSQLKH